MSVAVNEIMMRVAKDHGINPTLVRNWPSAHEKVGQEKQCRICQSRHDLTRHHLVPHSWFIKDKPGLKIIRNTHANIIPLCETCHREVDGVRNPTARLEKRAAIREALYTNEVAFILQVRGAQWLEEHYPREV